MLLADLIAIEDKPIILAAQRGGHKLHVLRLERFDGGRPRGQGYGLIRGDKYFLIW